MHADDEPAGQVDTLALHVQLLDHARPWHRVSHHPYESDLFEALVHTAVGASTLPVVMDTMTIGLDTTAALVGAVARNADDETVAELIDKGRATRPLVVMVALLRELWRMLNEAGRDELAQRARDALLAELDAQEWADSPTWAGSADCGFEIFGTGPALDSPDTPRQALAGALESHPVRLRQVVVSCAGWVQRLSRADASTPYERTYREHPAWFPGDAVLQAAALESSSIRAADDSYDDGPPDGVHEFSHLLSHVLRLAARS